MNVFDLHSKVKLLNALDSQTISSDTTTSGDIIDTALFHALEFVLRSATVTDGDYTVQIVHGDDPALADGAVVPADELLGSVAFAAGEDNTPKNVGYLGKKRYAQLQVVSTGTSTGGVFSADAINGFPIPWPSKLN